MYLRLYVKYPLLFSDINETWIFMTDFLWKRQMYFIKIHLVGVELFHSEDGRTNWHEEANSHFLQIC
jgi:hypothetical protein